MSGWTCPTCGRLFRRTRQSHECAPAMTIDEYFSSGPAHERPIYDAVRAFVDTLGPIHVEPVSVGIFIKSSGSFIELRPMQRWVAMWFGLSRTIDHPKIARRMKGSGP